MARYRYILWEHPDLLYVVQIDEQSFKELPFFERMNMIALMFGVRGIMIMCCFTTCGISCVVIIQRWENVGWSQIYQYFEINRKIDFSARQYELLFQQRQLSRVSVIGFHS